MFHLDWDSLRDAAQAINGVKGVHVRAAEAATTRDGQAARPGAATQNTTATAHNAGAATGMPGDAAIEAGVRVRGGCPAATLQSSGERVAASQVRQWLCDCDVLPMVFNGTSIVLDVGRTRRLVPPDLRAVLEARDQGCIFAGCPAPPAMCHAHHIIPWWAGGPTRLDNLVLVCPHHHGVVEPSPNPDADPGLRWRVHLPPDGPPRVIPPRRVDPTGRPRIHARYHHPLRT